MDCTPSWLFAIQKPHVSPETVRSGSLLQAAAAETPSRARNQILRDTACPDLSSGFEFLMLSL